MKLPHRLVPSRLSWPSATRIAPLLAWGAALSITAWVGADLFWRATAPRPAALPVAIPSDPQVAAQSIAGRHLMGQATPGGPAAPVAAPERYALQAVVTGGDGRPGWAILSVDGGPQQGIVEGQDIQPGVRLLRLHADNVEISSGGARRVVRLVERGDTGSAPGSPSAPPALNSLPPLHPSSSAEIPDSAPRLAPPGFPLQTPSNQ